MSVAETNTLIIYNNNFAEFEKKFPTVESRFKAAAHLANPDSLLPPEKSHFSRNILAAHWGDETEELRQTAYMLYALSDKVKHYVGQPVIVLRAGSGEDILFEEERLTKDVEIDVGILAAGGLVHSFAGNITGRGMKRMGIKPPFLGFGTQLPVTNRMHFKVGVAGDFEVVPIDDSNKDSLPIYLGVVTLEFNSEEFQATKRVERRDALFGRPMCNAVLTSLIRKTNSEAAGQILSELTLATE